MEMWSNHTLKYYLAIRKSEMLSFIVKWKELKRIVCSKASHKWQKQTMGINKADNLTQ